MNTKKVVALKATENTLESAALEYKRCSNAFSNAKKKLEEAKTALLPLLGRLPSEGTVHITAGEHDVCVRTRLTRRLNKTKVKAALKQLPTHVTDRVLPVTRKLNVRELRYLEENDTASYKCVRSTFTVSKASPSVEVV